MNCKPNELAIVVAAKYDGDKALLGKIRKVTHIIGSGPDGDACLAYEGERLISGGGLDIDGLADCTLRPIRPEADPVTTDCDVGVEA